METKIAKKFVKDIAISPHMVYDRSVPKDCLWNAIK